MATRRSAAYRTVTGESPEFVDGDRLLDGRHGRLQHDDANSPSCLSRSAVARHVVHVLPNSGTVRTSPATLAPVNLGTNGVGN